MIKNKITLMLYFLFSATSFYSVGFLDNVRVSDEDLDNYAKARASIELCRQAGQHDVKLITCFMLLNEIAKKYNYGLQDNELIEIYMSEEMIDSQTNQDLEIKFRKAVRECLENSKELDSSLESTQKVIRCIKDSKGYTSEDILLNLIIVAEEDTRRRYINGIKSSNPEIVELLKQTIENNIN